MNDTTFQGNGKVVYVPVVVNTIPNADVRPSAKWKLINGLMRCPACGKAPDESYYVSVDGWRYCPICGERLDPPEEGE